MNTSTKLCAKMTFGIAFLLIALVLTKNVKGQIPDYLSQNGLLAWYPFTSSVSDSSSLGRPTNPNAIVFTSDRFNKPMSAAEFNGMNSYVDCGGGFNLNNYSFSLWVNLNSKPDIASQCNFFYALFSKINKADGFANVELNLDYNKYLQVQQGHSNTWASCYSSSALSYSGPTWFHVAATYDGSHIRLYVNGVLSNTSASGFVDNTNANLYLGARKTFDICGRALHFFGKLDDVAVYNRVLTNCEITKLYLNRKSLVLSQPQNYSASSGMNATFTISDTGAASYQWQQDAGMGFVNLTNAGMYSGVTSKNLLINGVSGSMNNYKFRCIRTGATCVDTSDAASLFVTPMGIHVFGDNKEISVSPNPVVKSCEISAEFKIERVLLLNALGEIVYRGYPNDKSFLMNMEDLPAGIFYIKLNDIYVRQIVKM